MKFFEISVASLDLFHEADGPNPSLFSVELTRERHCLWTRSFISRMAAVMDAGKAVGRDRPGEKGTAPPRAW